MAGLLLDTDVLIDYLRGTAGASTFLEEAKTPFLISAMTVGELYSGVREGNERAALEVFLQEFEIILISHEIARRGGLLCRDYRKSHGVGLADALIAATAEIHHLELVTLNQKHFPMLDKVIVPYKKFEI